MIEDVTDSALSDARNYRVSAEYNLLGNTPAPKKLGISHEAVLHRIGSGIVLGPWSNILLFGPKYWKRSELKALIGLVGRGDVRVLRVSGSDMNYGEQPISIVPPGSHFYYVIVPAVRR